MTTWLLRDSCSVLSQVPVVKAESTLRWLSLVANLAGSGPYDAIFAAGRERAKPLTLELGARASPQGAQLFHRSVTPPSKNVKNAFFSC